MQRSTPRTIYAAKRAGPFRGGKGPRFPRALFKWFCAPDQETGGWLICADRLSVTVACLITLSAWVCVPGVRAQGFSSTFSKSSLPTISVRELQVPEKAVKAYVQGLERLQRNDPAKGLSDFDRALELCPDFYEAYYGRGVAELYLHQHKSAMESFQKAIDLSGGHFAPASFGYALTMVRVGKPEEAEPVVRRGLDQAPTLAEGHLVLAVVLIELHRIDEAEKSARAALELNGHSSKQAYLALANIHAQRGDYSAEMHDLETYLKLDPHAPDKQKLIDVMEAARKLAANLAKSQKAEISAAAIQR